MDEVVVNNLEAVHPENENGEINEINGWNDKGEEILLTWANECIEISQRHLRIATICKYLHMSLILPSMVLSYIFGTTGLTTTTEKNATTQGYILLVVGLLSTLLKFGKFEKRTESHKHKGNQYKAFGRKLKVQLASSRANRKPFESFMEKTERDYRKLLKNK